MKRKILLSVFIFSCSFFTLLNAQNISTVAGHYAFGGGYSGDGGQATLAELHFPYGVVVDGSGNIYISDNGNEVIREVMHSSGDITTIAGIYLGTFAGGYSGDGGPATAAELNDPAGITLDASGNLYIADAANNVIRKVTMTSGIITTVAGNFSDGPGYSGNGGPATSAELNGPSDVKFDASGNMFIADYTNEVVRRVDHTTEDISTVAGINVAGYSGDGGPATDAELDCPAGIAIDHSGNIFITGNCNNVIRRVDNGTGDISTIAGQNHITGYRGDGGPATDAELFEPVGITVDGSGNIFFSDEGNVVIRKISNSGTISTIAGNNAFGFGYSGDGGLATAAELYAPEGVALDASGNLYIADNENNVTREVNSVTIGIEEISVANDINIYPNPATGEINIIMTGDGYSLIKLYDVFGKEVYSRPLNVSVQDLPLKINTGNLSNGVYIIQIINQKGNISKRIVMEK